MCWYILRLCTRRATRLCGAKVSFAHGTLMVYAVVVGETSDAVKNLVKAFARHDA